MTNWLSALQGRLDRNLMELLSGASTALILKIIGAGLIFTFNILIARVLGAEGAGQYFLTLSIITVAVVSGRMGLDKTVLRFTSANAASSNWQAVKGIQRRASLITLSASTLATITVFVLAPWMAAYLFRKPELTAPLRWMSFAILPLAFTLIYAHLLKGLKMIFRATWIEDVNLAGISLLAFYLVGRYWGVNGAVWSYLLATVTTAVLGFIFWHQATPHLRGAAAEFDTRIMLQSSMPLFWVALTTWIINRFGDFALGIWGTSADIGIFGVASRVATFISFSLLAINSIAAPKFAAQHGLGDLAALSKTAQNSIRIATLAASPLVLICLITPSWVMGIFGPEFVSGANVLVILTLAQLFNVVTGPVELLLMMSGFERQVRTNVIIVGVLNITLSVLLVPKYGALGAALAFAAGLTLKNLVSVWMVHRFLGLHLYRIPLRGKAS